MCVCASTVLLDKVQVSRGVGATDLNRRVLEIPRPLATHTPTYCSPLSPISPQDRCNTRATACADLWMITETGPGDPPSPGQKRLLEIRRTAPSLSLTGEA